MEEPNVAPPVVTAPVATAPAVTEPAQYAPLCGVTRTVSDSPVQGEAIQKSIASQTVSLILFLCALLPAIAICLLRGLAGVGATIPLSALWGWGALVIALVVCVRAALPMLSGRGVTSLGSVAAAVVVLLVPSVVVLSLELRQHLLIPLAVGITAIVLYALGAIALLLAPGSRA